MGRHQVCRPSPTSRQSAYSVIGAKFHTSEHRTHMESSGGTTLDNLVLVHVGKMSRAWQVMTSIWQLQCQPRVLMNVTLPGGSGTLQDRLGCFIAHSCIRYYSRRLLSLQRMAKISFIPVFGRNHTMHRRTSRHYNVLPLVLQVLSKASLSQ